MTVDLEVYRPLLGLSHRPFQKLAALSRAADDALGALRLQQDQINSDLRALAASEAEALRNVERPNTAVGQDQVQEIEERTKARRRALFAAREKASEEYEDKRGAFVAICSWLDDEHRDWISAGRPDKWRFQHFAHRVSDPARITPSSLDALRVRIASLDEAYRLARLRPCDPLELKERVNAAVGDLVAAGLPRLDPRSRHGDPFSLNSIVSPRMDPGSSKGATNLLLWLMGSQLKQRLNELVDQADLTGALTDVELDFELDTIAREKLEAEREEEGLLCALEGQGFSKTRRPAADPRAVLEIRETD